MAKYFISSKRLFLRPHHLDDAEFMVELNSDPEVIRYTGDLPFAHISEAKLIIQALLKQFEERQLGRLIVGDKNSGNPLGWCGLKWHNDEQGADLGFRFLRSEWGKGYATEAGKACLEWAEKEGTIPFIFARARLENIPSCRVLEKLGFKSTNTIDSEGFIQFTFAPNS